MDDKNITQKETPYAFSKHVRKSVAAAEVVLGPKALRRLFLCLLTDFKDPDIFVDDKIAAKLSAMFAYIDPQKQVNISIGEDTPGGISFSHEPISESISDDFQGYALVDIKTALAVAIRDDLTGLVLHVLQEKWDRDLTLEDAENINFHLEKLIPLLT